MRKNLKKKSKYIFTFFLLKLFKSLINVSLVLTMELVEEH